MELNHEPSMSNVDLSHQPKYNMSYEEANFIVYFLLYFFKKKLSGQFVQE